MAGRTAWLFFPLALSSTAAAQAPADSGVDRRPVLADRVREAWTLSIEGVTHAPLDLGAQIGVEAPFGLRVFGGYGWVPEAFIGTVTGLAANATNDLRARLVLESAEYSGSIARVTLGLRPFSKLGFYFDAGYAHVQLSATRQLPNLSIPGEMQPLGGYMATSSLDAWVLEFGHQFRFGRRVVFGAGLGIIGTLNARTRIVPTGGAPDDPLLLEGARQVDSAFERYGYIPTLTLRLGFDLL